MMLNIGSSNEYTDVIHYNTLPIYCPNPVYNLNVGENIRGQANPDRTPSAASNTVYAAKTVPTSIKRFKKNRKKNFPTKWSSQICIDYSKVVVNLSEIGIGIVKLTADIINQSMQYINPCRERELDLRGYKTPQIENLGATMDQFDTIDFSDNDLRKRDGCPYLPRLKCLLLNNNRIIRMDDYLHESIPNLESVVLTGNNIQELGDLEPRTHPKKLETLCLLVNPVSTKPYYNEYVAYKLNLIQSEGLMK